MQAMDSSHVALCTLNLNSDGFALYRCDKKTSIGLSLTNLAKILKCAGADDSITMRTDEGADVASFTFENTKSDKVSEFEFKLMDINVDHMGIPDTKYDCTVKMNAKEFKTVILDLKPLGDACTIAVTKEGISFSVSGDTGTGNVTVKQNNAVDDEKASCKIEMNSPVSLTFAMRYLVEFTKATPLAGTVHLSMHSENPLVVEYRMGEVGDIRYYLCVVAWCARAN